MHSREVVITGTGMLTHLGGRDRTLHAIWEGRSRSFDRYAPAVELRCRCTHAGLIPDERLTDEVLGITRKQSRFMGRASRMALVAVREALAEAGLTGDRELAVLVGSGTGDTDTHIEQSERIRTHGHAKRLRPTTVPRLMASTVSANLVQTLQTRGPSASVAAACAGGAWNVLVAAALVRDGLATRAVAGGCEAIDLHFHGGFDAMRAYCADVDGPPDRASRPYAADRAGFIFGEGAGAMVLERRDQAEARGAPILGVLRGWGVSSDGHGEMVKPSRDGAARAMRAALAHAGVAPSEVSYINTHATSTPAGDIEEAHAVWTVFGDGAAYSSTKGFTGHMVSGAGAVEAVITLGSLRRGVLPACLNAEPLDEALRDRPPVLRSRPTTGRIGMSNSFGFGGTNACLVLEAQ